MNGPVEASGKPPDIKQVIRDLLAFRDYISAGDVARASGVTRQAAYYHLAQMVRSSELARSGAKRGTRYRRRAILARRYSLEGLEEDRVWQEVRDSVKEIEGAPSNVQSILGYAFTEMLNNAIEHSRGAAAVVRVWVQDGVMAFEVVDDGIGVFRSIREKFDLRDDFESIQQLAKGKQTTQPERHTGEGIFFTSKAVDLFELQSQGLRWTVDNRRGDQAVGEALAGPGTRVHWSLDRESSRRLQDVFSQYTDGASWRFSRSSVLIKLGERRDGFISRSEAKRVTMNLDAFDEVMLDFAGVREVGQGFVDELFRVWAKEHPAIKLTPVNMSPTVAAMIERGLGGALERK